MLKQFVTEHILTQCLLLCSTLQMDTPKDQVPDSLVQRGHSIHHLWGTARSTLLHLLYWWACVGDHLDGGGAIICVHGQSLWKPLNLSLLPCFTGV